MSYITMSIGAENEIQVIIEGHPQVSNHEQSNCIYNAETALFYPCFSTLYIYKREG